MSLIKLHSGRHYSTMGELQKDMSEWMGCYHNERIHQGEVCCGLTPLVTLLGGQLVWAEKNLAQIQSRYID